MRTSLLIVLAIPAFVSAQTTTVARPTPAPAVPTPRADEWSAYGHDAFGSRYSPATGLTRENVAQLTQVWMFRTGEMPEASRPVGKFEATPLMVDGTLFLSTPFGKAIALDPEKGTARWTYDAKADKGGEWGDFASRGVSTWVDPSAAANAPCRRRIYLPVIDARIVALDSRTGIPCADFGTNGTVSLRRDLRNGPYYTEEYELTSPPAVIRGTIVTGSAIADNGRTNAASGEVRAFDAKTGKLKWTWDPVPRDSADPQYKSWRGAMAHSTGAANAWSVIAADSARDLVFVPTGSPSPDYYGGERVGDNNYANSIVALQASTGKVVWHFQAVHHDLWDYDLASPPALVTLTRNGRKEDVVLQATKSGQLFVLDRATGRPVFPVEERAVPQSNVYGEKSSPTQPFNTLLPPLSPITFSIDEAWGTTPELRDACRAQIAPLRYDGQYTPPSLQGSLVRPSNIGGAHWGGVAFDPERQIAIVPVNTLLSFVQLIRLDELDTLAVRANTARLDDQYTRMHGTPYVMRRRILKSPGGMPCNSPPWGSLVALDLAAGKLAWSVPLGDAANVKPEAAAMFKAPSGLPNLGGPIASAGGLIFIGAALDHKLRAFDVENGKLLWQGDLPGGARATPMTYSVGGKQYVVVSVGGADDWGRGDYVIGFAIP